MVEIQISRSALRPYRSKLNRLALVAATVSLAGCHLLHSIAPGRIPRLNSAEASLLIWQFIGLQSAALLLFSSPPGAVDAMRAAAPAAGTLYVREPYTGRVLFAREDGGRWEQLSPAGLDARAGITEIIQLPGGRVMLVASYAGVFRVDPVAGTGASVSDRPATLMTCSADSSACFTAGPGPAATGFRRSVDQGATWTTGGSGLPTDSAYESGVSAMFSPAPGICLITLFDGRVYRSTNSGGAFTESASLPLYSYPSAFAPLGTAVYVATSQGVFRSNDGGVTFSAANGNLPGTNVLSVATRGDSVYATLSLTGNLAASGLYRSRNGGTTWTLFKASVAATRITGAFSTPTALYATSNAGLLRTRDDGATWEPFGNGLNGVDTRALLVTGGALLQGTYGARSGVFRFPEDGSPWTTASSVLDGQRVMCLTATGSVVLAGTEGDYGGSSGIFRSTDGGKTWAASSTGLPLSGSGPLNFNALAGDGTTWIAAGASPAGPGPVVFRSTDDGVRWTSVGDSLSAPGTGLFSASFAKAGSGRVLLVGGDGGVYRSMNDGTTWSALVRVAASPSHTVSALVVEGSNVYAAVSSPNGEPGVAGVWESTDQGLTWRPYGTTFSGPTYRTVSALAFRKGSVYAGTGGGAIVSPDRGVTWKPLAEALGFVTSLAVTGNTLHAGLLGGGVAELELEDRAERLVPIVLDVKSGTAHYTTELSLTNRGETPLSLSLRYTASLGEGSGSVPDSMSAGQQLVIGDVIAYLRSKGLAIPSSGAQAGTLLVTFEGVTDPAVVFVTARTASQTAAPQPPGRAGLAYAALEPLEASTSSLTIFGLRSNATDRSNVGVFSMSDQPVTLRVTAFSGAKDELSRVVADGVTLPAFGWKQFDRVLDQVGMTTGWVTVERTSSTGSFSAYGVVNDNGTNDGSYMLPVGTVLPFQYMTIPVLVESTTYRSELVLTNGGQQEAAFELTYRESITTSGGTGGTTTVRLAAGEQRIIPETIDFLRTNGVKVGPKGSLPYVGALHVGVTGIPLSRAFAGARTAARSSAAGQFGLFTSPLFPGDEAATDAWVYGLMADDKSRSNVAVFNTGTGPASAVQLEVTAYDGDASGVERGEPWTVTLEPGQFAQQNNFLGTRGIRNGWVRIRSMSGTGAWGAYGVVNDGGQPNQKTDDGAFVPMKR